MSAASEAIIDAEWTVIIEVAQPRSIVACNMRRNQDQRIGSAIDDSINQRLYAADVEVRADELYGPRPYRLTVAQRREIAEYIDAQSQAKRYDKLLTIERAARAASASPCAPSRQNWYG